MKFGFIIGTGRCGTTLLAKMLNSHPEICVPHELQILNEYSGNGKRLKQIFDSGENLRFGSDDFIKLITDRCPYRFQEYFDFEGFFRGRIYPEIDLQALVNQLFTAIAKSQGKAYFIEQTPWYGQDLKTLDLLFPNAKYIHLVRDGRDVSLSFARTPWWHKDLNENLRRWTNETKKIMEDAEKLHIKNILHIKYEHLVIDTQKTIQQICDFLGVPFYEGILNPKKYISYEKYFKGNPKKINSKAFRKWNMFSCKRNATFTESVEAWKKYEGNDFHVIEEESKNMLRQLGYDVQS